MGKFLRKRDVRERTFLIVALLGIVFVLTLAFLSWAFDRIPDSLTTITVIAFSVLILCWVVITQWFVWSTDRWKRRAKAANGRLCLHCGFDMNGLDDSEECPECGSQYNEEEARLEWRRVAFGRSKVDWEDAQ